MKKKKKNKKKINKSFIYFIITSILLCWISLTTILILGKYDILPFKYFLPTILGLTATSGLFTFLMIKKKITKKIKIPISIISIILAIILAIILVYLNKTFKFLNSLTSDGYKIENYSVIVLNNDKYNEIKDLEDKKLGYFQSESIHVNEALTKVEETVKTNNEETQDCNELINKLYDENIDAMIIEESYLGIIEETNPEFSNQTKVIYHFEIKTDANEVAKNVDVNKETFNIYISGIDTYGSIASVSRSDVNIVATINPKTHQIVLTTIPRDYYVQLDGTTGYKDKLTHAGIHGVEKSIKTIENLLDIEINYYVKVNFSSVEKIIDVLGGVDVYSEYTFTSYSGYTFKKGYNRVNGAQALDFVRTRKTVSGGDRTRGINQEALIEAMIKKACTKDIITKYSSILKSIEGSFQTNMPTDKITDLIKKQLDDMKSWTVTSVALDGAGSSEFTHSYPSQRLYVMIPDEKTVENAKEKIRQVTNDEILENTSVENNGSVNVPNQVKVYEEPEKPQIEEPKIEEPKEILPPVEEEIEENNNEQEEQEENNEVQEDNNEETEQNNNEQELANTNDENENNISSITPKVEEENI